jgi:hypothetical protein
LLVQLVEEYRRGARSWLPGAFLEVTELEAGALIESGAAVPIRRFDLSREFR